MAGRVKVVALAASVLATATSLIVDAAVDLGLPRASLLARARLDEEQLRDPDAHVSLESHMAVWRQLIAAAGDRDVGIELGRAVTLGTLGVVGHALGHAATMRDALPFYGRCAALVSDLFMPRIHERDGRVVFEQVSPPELVWLRHPGEMCLAAALTLARGLTGVDWPALAVRFQHAAPTSRERVDAFFGRRASFGAPSYRLELDAAALSAPIRGADPQVFEYLGRHAEALVATLPHDTSVAEQVRRSIGPMLASGEPPQDRIARRLGMSGRTLQRRLRDEGTTFAGVLDGARRELAMVHVAEARLSSAEIAFLLGYAEPTAFFRAFRRWTGTTPRAYREAGARTSRDATGER